MTDFIRKNMKLIALVVAAVFLLYYVNAPLNNLVNPVPTLQTINEPGYHHFWTWGGYTRDEFIEGPSRTVDETNFPISSQINEIVDRCKYEVLVQVSDQLVTSFAEKGYKITIRSVTPTVKTEVRVTSRQVRDYTEITRYVKLHVSCVAVFDSDKPIAESPFPAWALYLLTLILDNLPGIILATLVGLGIYAAATIWANSFFVQTQTITTEYYDSSGNLTKRVQETITGSSVGGTIWLIMVVIVIGAVIVILARGRRRTTE